MSRKSFSHPIWQEMFDILMSGDQISKSQVSYLVRLYEQFQRMRLAGKNIVRSAKGETSMVNAFSEFAKECEKELKYFFKIFARNDPVCKWASSIIGIDYVFATLLRSYIDMENTHYVGRIWSFAGLAKPHTAMKPKKGEKLQHCKRLKSICYLIGKSFKLVSINHPNSFYGMIYRERKKREIRKNNNGDFADQAELKLKVFNIGKDTEAYKWYSSGKLPPNHLDARAMRRASKLFLSHWHHVAYREEYGKEPPMPFAIQVLGHSGLFTVDDVLVYEQQEFEKPKKKVG